MAYCTVSGWRIVSGKESLLNFFQEGHSNSGLILCIKNMDTLDSTMTKKTKPSLT
jgi:hypothetical protein